MKVRYQMIEEEACLEGEKRTSYGIVAYADAENKGPFIIQTAIHDVSLEKEEPLDLVHTCNRLELSILHLYDVVEDFLALY